MIITPDLHFKIESNSDLLASIDVWEKALPGIFEKAHSHAYYELLIFNQGGGTHRIGNDEFAVDSRSIHLVPSNTIHELKRTVETDGYEIIFSSVFLNKLQEFDIKTNYLLFASKASVSVFSSDEFEIFINYFNKLVSSGTSPSMFYNIVAQFMLELISKNKIISTQQTDIAFEKRIRDLISLHFKEKRSLNFYATQLNMSIVTLQRKTKVCFGKTVTEMQNEKILQEIKYLLSKRETSIKDLVYDFNFYDESHFNRFFKSQVGVTPSNYRKQILN